MLSQKIEHYKKDTGLTFPSYYPVSYTESLELLNKHSKHTYTHDDIFTRSASDLQFITNELDTDNINAIVEALNVKQENNILLYWSEDEAIIMKWDDVIKVWDYLWYDVADEAIILVFEEQKKIVLITHWEAIYCN